MDEIKWLQDAAGQSPAPPRIDVTDSVMRTLKQHQPAQPMAMLLGVAVAGWAIAVVAIVFAQQAVSAWQNPLGDLIRF
jgi:hypothetical protein